MQELDHQTSKSFKGTRDANSGADFDEHTLGRVDVYLEFSGFVDGRVEEGKKTLFR